VSTNGPPFLPPFRATPAAPEGSLFALAEEFRPRPRHRYWLHALLLVLTLISTTVVGAGMAHNFAQSQPIDLGELFNGYVRMWQEPSYLLAGLPFSLTLLTILLAHELGHFLTARYYLVDVTLPFFLPFPTLIGTLGAFIRIRSPILSKRILFDIGIAGPLAGFVALVSPLVAGVALSKVVPGIGHTGDLAFGTPLIIRLMEWVRFPGMRADDIYLHPVARAAWAGLLATALNLLPIGQLDGGHILYALVGERTKYLSRFFIFVLVLMGAFVAYSWLLWAALLFFFGMRHPAIFDPTPLGGLRMRLALAALAVFLLSFTAAPVHSLP
jgi:membrane-associated protease RseP (regulator of RpoE activity)